MNFPSNCSLIMSFWQIRVYENPGNGDLETVRVNVVLNLLASEWYDEKWKERGTPGFEGFCYGSKKQETKVYVFKKEFCFESIIQSVLCTYWA